MDLGTLGGQQSEARSINDVGQIAGYADLEGVGSACGSWPSCAGTHAFLYDAGILRDLGTLGGTYSAALGLNTRGDVVGYSEVPQSGRRHAFLYTDGQMLDLNLLVDAPDWISLDEARSINRHGWIAGRGTVRVGLTGGPESHAFLLRVVP